MQDTDNKIIDPDLVDSNVLTAIVRNMGYEPDDEAGTDAAANLTVAQAFYKFCCWHGLMGYAQMLIQALDSIRESAIHE